MLRVVYELDHVAVSIVASEQVGLGAPPHRPDVFNCFNLHSIFPFNLAAQYHSGPGPKLDTSTGGGPGRVRMESRLEARTTHEWDVHAPWNGVDVAT